MKIWKPEDRDTVRIMLLKKMTYSEIAESLKTTRNSIASFIRRSNLQRRPIVIKVVKDTPPPPPPPPPPTLTVVRDAPPTPMMLCIEDLTDYTCRAPFDHEDGTKYCGHPVHYRTYCAYHESQFYVRRNSDAQGRPVYRYS